MENNVPNNQGEQNYQMSPQQSNPQQMPPQQFPQYQPVMPPQKPKKPVYKKWWFWVIVVILILIIGSSFGGNSESDGNKTTESASVSQKSTTEAPEKETEKTTEKTTTKKETTTKFSKKKYKETCKKIPFKDLARNPDKHEGKKVKFTGEVIQVIESTWGNSVEYRIAVSKESWGYSADDVVYVTYTPSENESRILEDDIVTFYGEFKGLYSYNSTLGGKITIPQVEAKVIDLK